MSTERQSVTVRDLVEEAKKRVVFLIICAIGLSYLMSREYSFLFSRAIVVYRNPLSLLVKIIIFCVICS